MTDACSANGTGAEGGDPAGHEDAGAVAAPGIAKWLCLAATPAFAVMALLTGAHGDGAPEMLCWTGAGASRLNSMATMYLLMSALHAAPWLQLLSRWRSGG